MTLFEFCVSVVTQMIFHHVGVFQSEFSNIVLNYLKYYNVNVNGFPKPLQLVIFRRNFPSANWRVLNSFNLLTWLHLIPPFCMSIWIV